MSHLPSVFPEPLFDPASAAVLGAVIGAVVGSFLATLALRWPAGQSVVRGRSRCDGCGRPIPAAELVPIASFVVLAGRCSACRAPIDPRHPLMEVTCAAIGLVAFVISPGWAGVAGAVFGWSLAILALLDAGHFWLPDRLTLPLVALGLLCGLAQAPPWPDRAIGALAGWGMLALVGGIYQRVRGRSGIGGGDPKLLAAVGAWLGWAALPMVLLGASGLGLGWALGRRVLGWPVTFADRLPFGTLLAPAAFAYWIAAALGLIG